MTQESNVEDAAVPKLLVDRPSDFRFHAAYNAYSDTWDKTTLQEAKKKLNEIMLSLSKEEISYSSFYKRVDQFRRSDSKHYAYPRRRIETQRKRDWRRIKAKKERNARHRKR